MMNLKAFQSIAADFLRRSGLRGALLRAHPGLSLAKYYSIPLFVWFHESVVVDIERVDVDRAVP